MLKWSCLKSAADMRANDRGHVAVIFALSILPVVAIAGFALDFQQTTTRKVKVQAAVDAAVIAGARAMQAGKSDDEIRTEIKTYINNMVNADGATFTCNQPTISFPQGSQDISVDILCSQETTLSAVMGRSEIDFLVSSTSTWGIAKLDVAFMLDVSGSMNGSNRLTNLKNSTKEAIEVLLPEDAPAELIENTRIAMSTYNSMVDAGDFFEDVTGVPKTRTYTHQIGSDVSDVQEGEFDDNFRVLLWDADNDQLIAEIGDDSVVYVAENQRDDISITVEPRSGGNFSNSDVESMYLQLSGEVSKNQTENYAPYASFGDNNGNLHGEEFDFGDYEFRYRVYENNNKSGKIYDKTINFEVVGEGGVQTKTTTITSSCVWEREGDNAFNADKPGEGSYLAHREAWFEENTNHSNGGVWKYGHPEKPGHNSYKGTECRSFPPIELTNNRTKLENYVNSLTAGGGTAGHQGIAWSWYLIAPEWKDVFSASAEPMAYDEPDAIKAVILMTDGEFNRQIFDSQGSSDDQAKELCDNMKDKDIVVYTVALQAPNKGKQILEYCASGPEFYFDAQNGEQLTDAYRAIATSLSDLRIKF